MRSFIPTEEVRRRARGDINSTENYITSAMHRACRARGWFIERTRSRRLELVGEGAGAVDGPQHMDDRAAVHGDRAIGRASS